MYNITSTMIEIFRVGLEPQFELCLQIISIRNCLIVGCSVTGLAVALAFFICTSIVLPFLAVNLYQRSLAVRGTEVTSGAQEENMGDYYVQNYYDSIK